MLLANSCFFCRRLVFLSGRIQNFLSEIDILEFHNYVSRCESFLMICAGHFVGPKDMFSSSASGNSLVFILYNPYSSAFFDLFPQTPTNWILNWLGLYSVSFILFIILFILYFCSERFPQFYFPKLIMSFFSNLVIIFFIM